jgi:hypothetical protein
MAELRLSNGRNLLFWSTAQGLADRASTAETNGEPPSIEPEASGGSPSIIETQPSAD